MSRTEGSADTDAPSDSRPSIRPSSRPSIRQRVAAVNGSRGPWTAAAFFVVPYLLLMVVWAYSNPPAAAPDEPDHLVKSLGIAELHIGAKYIPSTPSVGGLARRNDSVSRLVSIPARLNPQGYACMGFHPTITAACQPTQAPAGTGSVVARTTVGSYPPALYLPIGLAAHAMSTPASAFFAGRTVCLLMAALLLFFGAAHLIRWLGRPALLGAFVGLTPLGVYASSVVSTSGVEICGAFAVACVAVVAMRRPGSLAKSGTQLLLAVVGAALILSRQLGIVTFTAIMVLMLLTIGWRPIWHLVRTHRPAFLVSLFVLLGSGAGIYLWERGYDHPTQTGSPFNASALVSFSGYSYRLVRDGIGTFGWLDTPLFRWATMAWILLAVLLVGMAIILGERRDRWSLTGWLVATYLVAFGVYASVFYPIRAGLQGRHILPFFILCPILAGVVVAERLQVLAPDAARRVFGLVALVMPVLQLTGLYVNARRYAVGTNGPYYFFGSSKWHPVGSWAPWTVLAVIGTGLLAAVILACRPAVVRDSEMEAAGVAG